MYSHIIQMFLKHWNNMQYLFKTGSRTCDQPFVSPFKRVLGKRKYLSRTCWCKQASFETWSDGLWWSRLRTMSTAPILFSLEKTVPICRIQVFNIKELLIKTKWNKQIKKGEEDITYVNTGEWYIGHILDSVWHLRITYLNNITGKLLGFWFLAGKHTTCILYRI